MATSAVSRLIAREVGIVMANVNDVHDPKWTTTTEPFTGFKVVKPMVFSGVFPVDAADYDKLRDALTELRLNDSAFTFEPETSQALGFGFRCGYLGLLHMEIVQERLKREYELALITTAPSVVYRVTDTQGEVTEIDSPAKLPPLQKIATIEEPILTCHIHGRTDDVGAVLKLSQHRRGVQRDVKYIGTTRLQVTCGITLAEVMSAPVTAWRAPRAATRLDYELKCATNSPKRGCVNVASAAKAVGRMLTAKSQRLSR